MTTLQEAAMRKALNFCEFLWRDTALNDYTDEQVGIVMKYLRTALAQQDDTVTALRSQVEYLEKIVEDQAKVVAQQGEPTAYLVYDKGASSQYVCFDDELGDTDGLEVTPLYTAAPAPQAQPVVNQQMTTVKDSLTPQPTQPAQPLTEPEIHALAQRKAMRYTYTAKRSEVMYGFSEGHIVDFVRAIEKEGGL